MATRKRGFRANFFVSENTSFQPFTKGESLVLTPDENGTIQVQIKWTEFYNDTEEK